MLTCLKWIAFGRLSDQLCVALACVVTGRNSERINSYSYMWRRILVDRTANVTDRTTLTSFLKTSIVNEFFVEDVFTKNYAAAGKTGSPFGSALLGTAKLRQLRVKASPCHSLHVKLNDQGSISSTECYAQWTDGAEEKSFSRAGAALVDTDGFPFLEHSTAEETLEPEFEGKFGTYHGGGYLAELSSENAAKIIDDLDKQQFFDPKTRAIFLDFLVYSPDDDIFASCRVAMEFIAGGVVFPTVFVYGFLLDRYPETGSSVKVGLELFVYSVVVGYVIQEYRHFKHQGWARYKSIDWVHLDVLNYLLFLMGAYYKALYLQKFYNYLDADAELDSTNISVEIRTMATSLEFQDRLAGANGFLLWLKMFKYVLVTRRMMRQGKTLVASFSDVATFGFLFSIVSYAFATGGHLLFKRELDEFSTINSSARTMLRAVFGESLFPRLIDAAGLSGYMYLLIWLVVSKTILLNVVISILHHAYQSVLVQEASKPSLTIYEKILNELAKRREEQQKLEDDGAEQRNLKGRKVDSSIV